MFIKILMLVVFFGIMVGVGFYSRKHAANVDGFVLGGRSVGPWLTANAFRELPVGARQFAASDRITSR